MSKPQKFCLGFTSGEWCWKRKPCGFPFFQHVGFLFHKASSRMKQGPNLLGRWLFWLWTMDQHQHQETSHCTSSNGVPLQRRLWTWLNSCPYVIFKMLGSQYLEPVIIKISRNKRFKYFTRRVMNLRNMWISLSQVNNKNIVLFTTFEHTFWELLKLFTIKCKKQLL